MVPLRLRRLCPTADVELKNILARQPGPEVAEQLSTYQQSLMERAKQMEQMEAELTMSHTQVSSQGIRKVWARCLRKRSHVEHEHIERCHRECFHIARCARRTHAHAPPAPIAGARRRPD